VPTLIQTVCNGFKTAVAERRLELKLEDMRGLPEVTADLEGLRKVFYHLIGNAIKYTPTAADHDFGPALTGDKAGLPESGIEIIVSDTASALILSCTSDI